MKKKKLKSTNYVVSYSLVGHGGCEVRICSRCQKRKQISSFYKCRFRGLSHRCKPCAREHHRQRKEKDSVAHSIWYRRPGSKEIVKRNVKKYRSKNPMWESLTKLKKTAYIKVRSAIRSGKLKRGLCSVCGSRKQVEAHHPNYRRPLFVKWLCHKCHRIEHKRIRSTAKEGK